MNYKIIKSEIPVLWLDTHAITKIAHAVSCLEITTDDAKYYRDVFELIISLRKQAKIICFESDQLMEISIRDELIEPSVRVLTQISQGTRTSYEVPVMRQNSIAMKSFIKGNVDVEILWSTAFNGDPFQDSADGPFFIRAILGARQKFASQQKITNESIAEEWERLRQQYVTEKVPEAERRDRQIQLELYGQQKAFLNVVKGMCDRGNGGRTEDELWREINMIGRPVAEWRTYGGAGGVKELGEFYGSSHYTLLPHVQIRSRMSGQKIIIGEPIRRGDVADINNISALMPYCTLMVLDAAMIGLVKTLNLDSEYDCKVLRLKDLQTELQGL